MNLDNKTIVITGAARGLGLAIAEWLAKRGTNLVLIDLDTPELYQAEQTCIAQGAQALALAADVTSETEVANAVSRGTDEFGSLHGLVNNAGILRDGLLVKARDGEVTDRLSLEQWQAVIDVNLTGVFLCGREVAASMIATGSQGVIINMSSLARTGNFGQSSYSAAKAGVAALTVTWAKELARFGIRCAGVAPGVIETDMTLAMKSEARAKLTSAIPLQRMGRPDEIASAVGFIFANDYYNGRILELDGGLTF